MPDPDRFAFRPADDPLGRTAVLEHTTTIPVLGVPLQIRSNAPDIIALAATAFARWRSLDPALVARDLHASLDIVVHPGDEAPLPTALVLRRHGSMFVAAGGANLFVTDLQRAHATVFLTPTALANPSWVDWHALAWGRFVVSLTDRVPFHAAAVVRNGTAVLLIGSSGVGKSTLAYACARAGWQILAEEVVHVSLRHGLRLWGDPAVIGLSEDAIRWFPELAGHPVSIRPDGKRWRPVPVPTSALGPLMHTGPIVLCRLDRGDGAQAEVERMDAPTDVRAFFEVEDGFDQMPEQFPAAAAAMLEQPVVKIHLDSDPRRAVELVGTAGHAGGIG